MRALGLAAIAAALLALMYAALLSPGFEPYLDDQVSYLRLANGLVERSEYTRAAGVIGQLGGRRGGAARMARADARGVRSLSVGACGHDAVRGPPEAVHAPEAASARVGRARVRDRPVTARHLLGAVLRAAIRV